MFSLFTLKLNSHLLLPGQLGSEALWPSYISLQGNGAVGNSVCKEASRSQKHIRNDGSFDFQIFLKNKHEITAVLPLLLGRKAPKACLVLRDVPKLTSDSVALAGASLGARLGPTLGAGLGAGSAGAGGAATAGPLQGALHDGLCPPQVWVAAGGQKREAPSARVTSTLPTLTGVPAKASRVPLSWRRQG